MDQIRANTPAPIKANLMTEQLSVQMSWGNGGCTRAGSPGDQQSRELGPWATRRFRAMMRANAWGHDELRGCIHIIDMVERIYYPSFTYQFPLKLFYTEKDCLY